MKFLSIITIICLFFTSQLKAQVTCNVLTKYSHDGLTVLYTSPVNIDSTSDSKYAIGMEYCDRYNYITFSLAFKSSVRKPEGDMVVKFTDSTSINVPLINFRNVNATNSNATNCSYLVLDKYMNAFKTKTIQTVILQMNDNYFKAIEMKQNNAFIMNSLACMSK